MKKEDILKAYFVDRAKKANAARQKALTPEERKEIARNAIAARWEKAKLAKKSRHENNSEKGRKEENLRANGEVLALRVRLWCLDCWPQNANHA